MTVPTSQQLNFRCVASFGDTIGSERIILDYTEPTTTTGFQAIIIPVELAASATDTQVNLASYVDTATFITILDRNNTGFKVAAGGTANKFTIAADGCFSIKNGAATPPTLYLDNVSTTAKAFIEIGVMGTSA